MLVKRIAYDGGEEALVVKLYSNLALLRTEQRQRGLVDKKLSDLNRVHSWLRAPMKESHIATSKGGS